jgi:hypothetical protein
MNQTFANSQQIQGSLNTQLQNVTNMGMAGHGFMPGEEANLKANNAETGAQQNVSAEQAQNQRNAGGEQGGAATSGAVAQGSENLASNAAAGVATANRNVTNTNAQLAQQNVTSGLAGQQGLLSAETGQADAQTGAATGAAGQSFQEQTTAYQPSNFWSGLGSSVLSMGLNAVAPGVGNLAQGLSWTGGGGATQTQNGNEDGLANND